jgi:hypothetical protein
MLKTCLRHDGERVGVRGSKNALRSVWLPLTLTRSSCRRHAFSVTQAGRGNHCQRISKGVSDTLVSLGAAPAPSSVP